MQIDAARVELPINILFQERGRAIDPGLSMCQLYAYVCERVCVRLRA